MYHYAQIDENGYVISDSYLSGPVDSPLMIRIEDGFNPLGHRYIDGEWVEVEPEEPAEPVVIETQLDRIERGVETLVESESVTDVLLGVE